MAGVSLSWLSFRSSLGVFSYSCLYLLLDWLSIIFLNCSPFREALHDKVVGFLFFFPLHISLLKVLYHRRILTIVTEEPRSLEGHCVFTGKRVLASGFFFFASEDGVKLGYVFGVEI